MERTQSSTVATLILIGGGIFAMMFRTPESTPIAASGGVALSAGAELAVETSEHAQGADVVLQDEHPRRSTSPRIARRQTQPDDSTRPEPVQPGRAPVLSESPSSGAPPSMPGEYGGLLGRTETPQSVAALPQGSESRRPGQPSRSTHVVREWDRLDDIALRYYGDPALAEEIFQANRHVLPSRNLLPLRTVLRLPTVDLSRRVQPVNPPRAQPRQAPVSPQSRTTLGSVR